MIKDHFPLLKGLILDMDGVLWHDTQSIGDLPEIFKKIESLGLSYVFATNNSSKTIDEYQDKLRGFGLEVSPNQITTSAETAFAYIRDYYPSLETVHIVGSESLIQNAKDKNFRVLDDDAVDRPDIVLVGIDMDLTYQKISLASKHIRDGAVFIATNTDPTYPTPNGLIPGAGVMVAAIQTASGKDPIIIGKPYPNIYIRAMKLMGLEQNEVLCVGDRLSTDILGAQQCGFPSAFVLSGVNTAEDLEKWTPQPDIVTKDLEALING
jgi:4-nitrophenyl phosphatase